MQRTLSIEEWHALASAPGEPLPPVWIHVVSGSMLPLIRPFRDSALLVAVSGDKLKPGDIVLFPAKCLSGDYCLHRLYKINGDRVQTMGDFCYHSDGWFPKKNILGKVLMIRRGTHEINCESCAALFLARLWMRLRLLRPFLLLPYRAFSKLKRIVRNGQVYHGS